MLAELRDGRLYWKADSDSQLTKVGRGGRAGGRAHHGQMGCGHGFWARRGQAVGGRAGAVRARRLLQRSPVAALPPRPCVHPHTRAPAASLASLLRRAWRRC